MAVVDSVIQLNQANPAPTAGLPSRIAQAIQTAAARTGVDFSYLLNKATQESSLDPNAKASGSSATGLFQFTNQTWLQMIKQNGANYGLGNYAAHISVDSNGTAHVSDPAWKRAILGLRNDPQLSAEMAGELDKKNMGALQANVGGKIGGTDLYLAHFLGAGGASDFLNAMRSTPNAAAATLLPDAAAANPSVFYNVAGQPRSLAQIYQRFAQKFNGTSAPTGGASPIMLAAAPTQPKTLSAPAYSYALASAAYTGSAGGGGIKADTPSMFASMILAQMDTAKMHWATLGTSSASANHNNKNALADLATFS